MLLDERPIVDVGKREDQMLDKISSLIRNRDAALDWIITYMETGVLDKETGEWLRSVLTSDGELPQKTDEAATVA